MTPRIFVLSLMLLTVAVVICTFLFRGSPAQNWIPPGIYAIVTLLTIPVILSIWKDSRTEKRTAASARELRTIRHESRENISLEGSRQPPLIALLADLSSRSVGEENPPEPTRRLRESLLLHAAESPGSLRAAEKLVWTRLPEKTGGTVHGVAVQSGQKEILLTDFLECLLDMPGLSAWASAGLKDFSKDDYEAAVWGLWSLVSASQRISPRLTPETATGAEIPLTDSV